MHFSLDEKTQLLAVRGVGPKVVERLEQMGFHSLAQLADADARDILAQGALLTGSSCWKNSPQARAAVQAAIGTAVAASTPSPHGWRNFGDGGHAHSTNSQDRRSDD